MSGQRCCVTFVPALVCLGLLASGAVGQSGQSASTNLQSTRPASALQPAASTQRQQQLEWLNTRLSENRSLPGHPKLHSSPTGGEGGVNVYLKRREELNRRLNQAVPPPVGQTTEPGAEGATPPESPISNPILSPVESPGQPGPATVEPPLAVDLSVPSTGPPVLNSESLSQSQPQNPVSERLSGNEPQSGNAGYLPFQKVDENGEIIDERLLPLLEAEKEEEAAKREPEPQPTQPLMQWVIPTEEPVPPSQVRPLVPESRASQYQLNSQKLWSQVPVRQPQSSQFGPGVNPSQVPFEGSGVRPGGVYGGFYQAPKSDPRNPGYSYQYRGPRLYSIGETEYPTGQSYESLPYYRR